MKKTGILFLREEDVCKTQANRGQRKPKDLPDDIPVTLRGVKLGSKPTDVTYGVRATSGALNGREAYEH